MELYGNFELKHMNIPARETPGLVNFTANRFDTLSPCGRVLLRAEGEAGRGVEARIEHNPSPAVLRMTCSAR